MMALTREFRDTVQARALCDPEFRRGLLTGALDCFFSAELEEGKLLLRDYINAAIGFEELGRLTGKTPKSLMRMLSTDGNPRADNLFSIIRQLQMREGIHLSVQAE